MMSRIEQSIKALREYTPNDQQSLNKAITIRIADQIKDILSDSDFMNLSLQEQLKFLKYVEDIFAYTANLEAKQVAPFVTKIFDHYLNNSAVGMAELIKLYDCQYLLYWIGAGSYEEMRPLNDNVVIPFSKFVCSHHETRQLAKRIEFSNSEKIKLCYMSQFCYQSGGNAIAPILLSLLRAHDKEKYEIYLYAWMYYSKEFIETIKSFGITVRCFELDKSFANIANLRQSFFDDKIDIVITDMNGGVPAWLFETRVAPVQILFQLGLPFWKLQNLEGVLQSWHTAPSLIGFDEKICFPIKLCQNDDVIKHQVDPIAVEKQRKRFPESKWIIGSYGRLAKVTAEHLIIIKDILARHSDTICVLGGTGDSSFIQDFVNKNNLGRQVFLVNEFVDGHVYAQMLDIFLDTFPVVGGVSAWEVLSKGKPIVSMYSQEMCNLNNDFRDSELLVRSAKEYVQTVDRLMSNQDFYERSCKRSFEIVQNRRTEREFADSVESALEKILLMNCNKNGLSNFTIPRSSKTPDKVKAV